MVRDPDSRCHPVVAFAAGVRAAAKEVADVEPVFMSTEQKADALRELTRAEAQLAGLRLRVMAVADDVAEQRGDRDVAAWLATETRTEYQSARADQELATRLDRRWHHVAAALTAGTLSVEQARTVVHALDRLPSDLPGETADRAESALIELADGFRPTQLRRLGRRILETVAPEVAEAEEARRLRAEEQRASRRLRVGFRPLGDGVTRITIDTHDSIAVRFKTYLHAYTSPRHETSRHRTTSADLRAASSPLEAVPYGERMAGAFAALLEHLDPHRLPRHGGDATTVMVTIGLDQLRTDLAAAGLVDGDLSAGFNLSADEARRLACTAQIIPVVLGREGEILDLGRTARVFSPAQRKAMRLRDRKCRAEGCTVPATWCEAHHLRPWSEGGRTDLADGVLLCGWHHRRVHDARYRMERQPSGDLRFRRRC